MKFQLRIGIAALFLFVASAASANYLNPLDSAAPENWFNLDMSTDGVRGVSTEVAYETVLKGKKSKTVVVAVIDSGVDIEHEDLNEVIWVNEDEIPDNGIDDDGNGYIDDIHGWNFIGGANGKNISADNLEMTRLYRDLKAEFDGMSEDDVKGGKAKKRYAQYVEIKKEFDKAAGQAVGQYQQMKMIADAVATTTAALGEAEMTVENVSAIADKSEDEATKQSAQIVANLLNNGVSASELAGIDRYVESSKNGAEYYYNLDFDPRAEIVGDDYRNSNEHIYGNNDVEGPEASHGTHVAGIIGAIRNNDVGMKGVANDVRIMSIRCVPDGDERDKDVANAIRYAVDNGASVINMSFGKGYSYDEEVVEKAIKYALKKDVLLVHAAGNSSQNNDVDNNFPNDLLGKKENKEAANWLEIGAANWGKNGNQLATFSNYGKEQVDVFAPGVDLYATIPQSDYASLSGTSMASPVVAGIAAVLRSYYPTLTAAQVKQIIMESAVPLEGEVNMPGSRGKTTTLAEISRTGGVANLVEAVKLAEQTKGKKKVKNP
jgi:subtilisin family serine protease